MPSQPRLIASTSDVTAADLWSEPIVQQSDEIALSESTMLDWVKISIEDSDEAREKEASVFDEALEDLFVDTMEAGLS